MPAILTVCLLFSGHLEMVKFLLEAGADQEHKTDEMHTALMEASMDGHVEVARLLLDSGAQVTTIQTLRSEEKKMGFTTCTCFEQLLLYWLNEV